MLRNILLLLGLLLTVACGMRPDADGTPAATIQAVRSAITRQGVSQDIQVVLVNSELVVGQNRFAIGLLDGEGHMIDRAVVRLRYFDLSDPEEPVVEQDAETQLLQSPDQRTSLYVHQRDFARAGEWGVEIQAMFPNETAAVQRIAFTVAAETDALLPGEEVTLIDTPTAADVDGDLSRISSAHEPNAALYRYSLVEAVESGRPTLLYIATPAFCASRLCGPGYEVFDDLARRYGEAVNFIHVEVYTGLPDPAAYGWELSPVMAAFGLRTEPWLYLFDSEGVVFYRVEGLFGSEEVEAQLQALMDEAG